ncbi:MAG TPA: hypothetical protein VEA60_07585 [Allosphingosinicella sp.]|nr:hypothetical protein [Allosphingosinicella sp.]
MPWTVITEIALVSEARARDGQAERELVAVQRLIREEGPGGFGLDAGDLAGAPSWDRVETACRPDLFIEVGGRRLWVELEIRPGRTIVFRRGRLE